MALRPLKPCCAPGCGELVRGARYCAKHMHLTKVETKRHDERRESSTKRGYGYKWQKARAAYLAAHPLCEHCLKEQPPRYTPATELDHSIPHKGDMQLFWKSELWQGLCAHHHSLKTAKEDGGFGNKSEADRVK